MAKTNDKGDVAVVAVFTSKGQKVREYSFEIHGERFTELAQEYAKKIGGSVK